MLEIVSVFFTVLPHIYLDINGIRIKTQSTLKRFLGSYLEILFISILL